MLKEEIDIYCQEKEFIKKAIFFKEKMVWSEIEEVGKGHIMKVLLDNPKF